MQDMSEGEPVYSPPTAEPGTAAGQGQVPAQHGGQTPDSNAAKFHLHTGGVQDVPPQQPTTGTTTKYAL